MNLGMNLRPAFACLALPALAAAIAWAPRDRAAKVPTYAENVAPILNRACVDCHRPGEVAPFSLIGYNDAKKRSAMIAAVTEAKLMPPWKAVAGYNHFLDESRLSTEELDTLKRWHAGGAPRGNAKKEPKLPAFKSEWKLGTPDVVLAPEKAYTMPAEGQDIYRNFVVKTDFKEPTWVRAVDVRPGNAKVVHHVIVFLDERGQSLPLEAAQKDGQPGYSTFGGVGFLPSGTLGGWAPGQQARYTPEGTAYLVKPGTKLVLQVHYHLSGKKETDQTKVALYLSKEPPKRELSLFWMFNFAVNIPPNVEDHNMRRVVNIPADVTIYNAMPHMHLLGRSMKAWLTKPDGTEVPMVWVDDWDFKWQMTYAFRDPIKAPKGSRITIEALYDNSQKNPFNPNNPPKRVTWGEETTDEMFLMIAAYTVDREGERAPSGLGIGG